MGVLVNKITVFFFETYDNHYDYDDDDDDDDDEHRWGKAESLR